MSYFTLSDGEKLYYEDRGNGSDTLVMMHGWTSSHDIYSKPVEILKEQARCIIYDHRGHGGSKEADGKNASMENLAGDLNEIIKGLSLDNITLLGWSMGAGVVFNYVRLYGCDALKQIVLCDMTPKQLNDDEWKLGLYQGKYTREDMERDAGKDFFSLYKDFALGTIPRLKKIPGFLLKKPLKEKLSACDEPTLRSLAASMKSQDNRTVIGQITVPVTYFYADPGSLFSPTLADWYREHVVTSFKAVRFSESTHMLISEYPEKFAKEVGKLLSK
ncbi:MAG: alpha/beta hydrolase [Lachnospiraceae bacterium]|nr:alpha/beta hydrolase [Lachnospiraceae bacterium]